MNYFFKIEPFVEVHEQHSTDDEKPLIHLSDHKCTKCNKVFKNEGSLKTHVRQICQKKKKEKPIKSETDPKEFWDSPKTCEICNKVFSNARQLNIHQKSTHNEGAKLFQCDKCEFETNHR